MKKFAFIQAVGALALGVVSLGAQATAASIDFESLKPSVVGTNPPTSTAPFAVGSNLSNFVFSGAWAWYYGMMEDSDPRPDKFLTQPTNESAFILNSDRGNLVQPGYIDLTWGGPDFLNLYLKSITFDIYVTGNRPFVTGFAGSIAVLKTNTTAADGGNQWATGQRVIFDAGSQVSSLRFGTDNGAGKIGLDNLQFEWANSSVGPDPGGTVPEPASFGLVALALLGAGFASRRRKST